MSNVNDMNDASGDSREARFERGLAVLEQVDGEAGRRVLDSLADISPELAHQVVAWASVRSTPARSWPRATGSWSPWAC